MTPVEIAKRMRVAVLALSLILQPVAWVGTPLAVGAGVGAVAFLASDDAEAKSRSSGGYSRPSASKSSSSVRTPSLGSSSGYSKPSSGSTGLFGSSSSAGDKALTRQGSGSALDSYRTKQNADRTPSASTPSAGAASGSASRGFGYSLPRANTDYYRGNNWSAPAYAGSMSRGFGMWDAMFLWFMLDSISRPSHAAFFHNNQNDPGYQQWRAEADKLAADNAELKGKLTALDGELAKQKGQPVTPGAVPDDVPKTVAVVAQPEAGGSSFGWVGWIVLLIGVFVLWRLWRGRRKLESGNASGGKENKDMSMFGTVGNYVNRKMSNERFKPSLFRVGMTVTIDPTPFILAGSKIKAVPPEDSKPTSVVGVGTVKSGAATVHRLYLSDDRFAQIHLDDAGTPDECRYFSVIDEIEPADEEEWGFWLDPAEGMIGWTEFQTKDGKVYPRAWSPGLTRVDPFKLEETIERVGGSREVVESAMLYAAPSGAAAPADKEYILVSVVEEGGRAWVRIAAGIDINPASLGLA